MWGFVIKDGAKMVNLHTIKHLAIDPDLKTLNPDIIIVANSKLNSNNNCENRIPSFYEDMWLPWKDMLLGVWKF